MSDQNIKAVLFDLGGVLVQLNGLPFCPEWFSSGDVATPKLHEWGISPVVQDFETGNASAESFARFTIEEFSLNTNEESFVQEFTAWPGPLFDGVLPLIRQLKTTTRVAIYSNTNGLHWPRLMEEMGLDGLFDHYFASHLIGLAKPNPKGFLHVAKEMQLAPAEILFLDDNPSNIKSAAGLGFITEQVQGLVAVKAALVKHQLLG